MKQISPHGTGKNDSKGKGEAGEQNRTPDEAIKEVNCKCGKEATKGYGKVILRAPKVLAISVNRYQYDRKLGMQGKTRKTIQPSYIVELHHHSINNKVKGAEICGSEDSNGNIYTQNRLRACVIHHGNTPSNGHYSACAYINENVLVNLNDGTVKVVDAASHPDIATDGYIFLYEKVDIFLYEKVDESRLAKYAHSFLAAIYADATTLSKDWVRTPPLSKFAHIGDNFMSGDMEQSAFQSLLYIAAREDLSQVYRVDTG